MQKIKQHDLPDSIKKIIGYNNNIAEIGYCFLELIRRGEDIRDATFRSSFVVPLQYIDKIEPESELEIKLSKGRSMNEFGEIFSKEKYIDMFIIGSPHLFWPDAIKTASYAVELNNHSEPNSYLYYFLVGLTVTGCNRRLKFCECCGWRFKRSGNSRYCPACSTHSDEIGTAKTTRNRQQQNIFSSLKDTKEYKLFLELSWIGEDYHLLFLTGKAARPAKKLDCDAHDFTPDPRYRVAKESLANLWASTSPSNRTRRAESTEKSLMDCATKGCSKIEASRQLSLSRAGVTKACQRNPDLAAAFEKAK